MKGPRPRRYMRTGKRKNQRRKPRGRGMGLGGRVILVGMADYGMDAWEGQGAGVRGQGADGEDDGLGGEGAQLVIGGGFDADEAEDGGGVAGVAALMLRALWKL